MEVQVNGVLRETVDRALTLDILPGPATNFTLLQRRGMWEFYLGGFLALPERLAAAHPCRDLVAKGGLVIEHVFDMNDMPPSTPVKPAPTWPH